MQETLSPGGRMRAAMAAERPLQIVGAINAYSAMLAERAGFRALYLSGAGVANASFGLPDLAITSPSEVLEDARRITAATALPLLVDIDTGWGNAFMISRLIGQLITAGVAAIQIEDQVQSKRCGHRPNKEVVSSGEMVDRLKAVLDARSDPQFVVVARTDAVAVEGLEPAIERAQAYVAAGADVIFAEACTDLDQFRRFTAAIDAPVLANITEFGQTPLFTTNELAEAGVAVALYPLTAFRAMSAAALHAYRTLRHEGTQRDLIDRLQTRADLYDVLHYHEYEAKLDRLFQKEPHND
jgi:methylisocitrate lyase